MIKMPLSFCNFRYSNFSFRGQVCCSGCIAVMVCQLLNVQYIKCGSVCAALMFRCFDIEDYVQNLS